MLPRLLPARRKGEPLGMRRDALGDDRAPAALLHLPVPARLPVPVCGAAAGATAVTAPAAARAAIVHRLRRRSGSRRRHAGRWSRRRCVCADAAEAAVDLGAGDRIQDCAVICGSRRVYRSACRDRYGLSVVDSSDCLVELVDTVSRTVWLVSERAALSASACFCNKKQHGFSTAEHGDQTGQLLPIVPVGNHGLSMALNIGPAS